MDYKNILVAINIFEDYQHILNSAASIANKYNAKLTLFMAIESASSIFPDDLEQQTNLEKKAQDLLSETVQNIDIENISYVIKTGKPSKLIASFAQDNHYDLVILGSHSSHGINLLLGSTSNSMLYQAPCDILVVRIAENTSKSTLPYRKILLATDFESDSDTSDTLVKQAKLIAKHYGVSLNAVTVIKHVTSPIASSDYGVIPNIRRDLLKETKTKFSQWLKTHDIESKPMSIIGDPGYEVAKYADEKNMDLVIVGSHNRSFIDRLFTSSTANSILHQIHSDVLVVRLK